jgi:hypothetical protein
MAGICIPNIPRNEVVPELKNCGGETKLRGGTVGQIRAWNDKA